MKEFFLKLFHRVFKQHELVFNFVAISLAVVYYLYGIHIGAYSFGYEKAGQLVFGLAVYFLCSSVIRIQVLKQFPTLFRYFDDSYEENEEWKILPKSQRAWFVIVLYLGQLLALAMLINAV